MPESSHAIHIAYDLSPSTVWCAFEFNPTDSEKLVNNLKRVDPMAAPISRVPSPHREWWPKSLEGRLDMQKIQRAGFVLYSRSIPISQVENETLLFAIDQTGHGYFFGD
jgi:hypothetical protein